MPSEQVDPVFCVSCDARVAVEQISEDEYQTLIDGYDWQKFSEQLRILQRVSDFYGRYPKAEGRIKPHFSRLLDSDDPAVVEQLCSGVPFDQIELPPDLLPMPTESFTADAEVIDYLRHHSFSLGPRLEFVREQVGRLEGNLVPVACPSCRSGWLRLDPEAWDNPSII